MTIKRLAALLWVTLLPTLSGQQTSPVQTPEKPVVFKTEVVARSTPAINYRHRSGATKIDFAGTALMPQAEGEAKVESKQGYMEIEVEFKGMHPATRYGAEYLTFVLWAITPEGRAANLGEVLLNGNRGKLNVTTELQLFGLVVTAEPYFAVTVPSDLVVLENALRPDTRGKFEVIDARFELLQRGQYQKLSNPLSLTVDPRVPLELYEARNAVQIARASGADQYAGEVFTRALDCLERAEGYQNRNAGRRPVAMMAREAVQRAEDARTIAIRRQEEERLARQRQEAADKAERARLQAEEEARLRAQAEAARQAEAEKRAKAEMERAEAEQRRLEAELTAARAAAAKAQAEAARAEAEAAQSKALLEQQLAREEASRALQAAEEAERLRQQAIAEKAQLRARLLEQFSRILETRDTERGLVVNMGDVLFDTGRHQLRQEAREKLARLSGIVLAYPGLVLEAEGHTDSVGADDYNHALSERRAQSVRDYLLEQGLSEDGVAARGLGETAPIASNDTAQGRQANRRVELIVYGEVIGTQIGQLTRAQ